MASRTKPIQVLRTSLTVVMVIETLHLTESNNVSLLGQIRIKWYRKPEITKAPVYFNQLKKRLQNSVLNSRMRRRGFFWRQFKQPI